METNERDIEESVTLQHYVRSINNQEAVMIETICIYEGDKNDEGLKKKFSTILRHRCLDH